MPTRKCRGPKRLRLLERGGRPAHDPFDATSCPTGTRGRPSPRNPASSV